MDLLPELIDHAFKFGDDFDLTMYNLACNKEGPLEARVLCQEAAKRNNLELLKDLSECFPITDEVYAYLAKNGNIEGLKWLLERYAVPKNVIYIGIRAVEQGHLECLKWMLENGYELHYHFLVTAAKCGHVEMVEFLHKNGLEIDTNVMEAAIASRSLPLIEWLCNRDCYVKYPCWYADAKNGLEVLKYIVSRELEVIEHPYQIRECLRSGDLDVAKWLWKHYKNLFDSNCCNHACESGNLELIDWLEEKGFRLQPRDFMNALGSGNVVLLERIRKLGHVVDEHDFLEACCTANTKVLDYLKELNCPFNSSRCYVSAAEYCQLEVLVWLKENDYPFVSDEFNTSEELAQYLLDLGEPGIVEEVNPILMMGDDEEEDETPIYNWIHANVKDIRHA